MTDLTPRDKYYQAIAIIQGTLSLDGSHPVLDVEGMSFPAQASMVVRSKHQPGQVQNFRVYPRILNKQAGFQLINIILPHPPR